MNTSELFQYPGFLFRRMQQLSISLFLDRLREFDITPLQYTILRNINSDPGIVQNTVAARAKLDASTVKDIIGRLESRGLVERKVDPADRRGRLVWLTDQGRATLAAAEPAVRKSQSELLAPLSAADQHTLLRLLSELIEAHEASSAESGETTPWRRLARSA